MSERHHHNRDVDHSSSDSRLNVEAPKFDEYRTSRLPSDSAKPEANRGLSADSSGRSSVGTRLDPEDLTQFVQNFLEQTPIFKETQIIGAGINWLVKQQITDAR